MPKYYPIMVDLEGQKVVVVGGGDVALRKVKTLIHYGADVIIVSPEVCAELQDLIDQHQCTWIPRRYTSTDIEGAVLVFSCTDKEDVNAQVARDAISNQRFVNVVDDPEKCSFIVPSIMQRGDLTIAVSTGGSSPMVASQIRAEIEALYGEEMATYLRLLKKWRNKVKHTLSPQKRLEFWTKVTDGHVRRLVKEKGESEAERVILQCFQSLLD